MAGISVEWDTSEVEDLIGDLRRVPAQVESRNQKTGDRSARNVREGWSRRAVGTARRHGVHYPKSIEDRQTGALEWTIEPNASMPQGGMSFEYGSRNQPPHLDMNLTMDEQGPKFIEAVAEDVLPWW